YQRIASKRIFDINCWRLFTPIGAIRAILKKWASLSPLTGNVLCHLQYQRFNQNYGHQTRQTIVILTPL
ncbi:MAG: hypothetical protein ACHQIM_13315, partial [Sphingobacteriales bacterium]